MASSGPLLSCSWSVCFCVAESLVSALLFFPPYQSLVNLNQSIAVFNISSIYLTTTLPTVSKEENNYENTCFFYRASFGLRCLLSLHTFFNFMNEKGIFPPFPIHLIFVASGVLIMCDMSLLIVASAYPQFCRVIFYINFNICICF